MTISPVLVNGRRGDTECEDCNSSAQCYRLRMGHKERVRLCVKCLMSLVREIDFEFGPIVEARLR